MSLGQVLEGDFFTEYIKIGNLTDECHCLGISRLTWNDKGNIMMLSEGRLDSENVFSLKEGKWNFLNRYAGD